MRYDVVIVGSGFGGAVAACRLAAAGRSVLVLERGRRWEPEDYPRRPGDAWLFDPGAPHRRNGWLELRFLDQMVVAQGAGVGGGSLIYANVCIDARPEAFDSGWPSAITAREMAPYYRAVSEMLTPMEIPVGQHTARLELMRRAADAVGAGERFQKVPLAIRFDPHFTPDPAAETPEYERSVVARNAQGREQGTCVHCGSCDVGCPTRAKNTLDLNYLAAAEDSGAVIAPLSLARYLAREDDGWRVHFDHLDGGRRESDSVTARRVILAAGSLGSTELLLRSRDEHRTLRDLPRALGRGWSSNGDFLTPAGYGHTSIAPTSGPTITSAIDFLDGSLGGGRYFVEDGGMPNLLRNCFEQRLREGVGSPLRRRMWLRLSRAGAFDSVMPWFGQSVDAADGSFYLGRGRVRPWRRVVKLDWNPQRSETAIRAMSEMHGLLTESTGGKPNPLLTWKRFRALVTPHPLGGCNMAAAPAAGVVDHACRVFAQDGLYVMDGAVIPRAIGRNPSKTIAAVAERAVALLLAED